MKTHFHIILFPLFSAISILSSSLNFSLPHPFPDSIADHVRATIKLSHSLSSSSKCLTGNPIDDCWRCSSADWRTNRQHLADCSIGFGRQAYGGRGGQIYVVTDSSDSDPVNPKQGTLRHAAMQETPLWITFSSDMKIRLNEELLVNSFKTIDGRGADVHISDGACITLQYVSNVIIHNVRVYNCKPAGNANIRSTPTHAGFRTKSDGDGISLYGAKNVWIDHCELSNCADGLIDAIMGSTGITISNNYFSHHNEVMLLGHNDEYTLDSDMQVTIAFNHFGPGLIQRMPRCRRGYIHVVNNDFTAWEIYAIGGSANPTINSQGNRYTASNSGAKEVTKRVDVEDGEWNDWNWRTEGDVMLNGAFFVPSGAEAETKYANAESTDPKSSALIDQLTMNAGVLGGGSRRSAGTGYGGSGTGGGVNYGGSVTGGGGGGVSGSGGGDDGYPGMVFGSNASRINSFLTLNVIVLLVVMLLSSTSSCMLL